MSLLKSAESAMQSAMQSIASFYVSPGIFAVFMVWLCIMVWLYIAGKKKETANHTHCVPASKKHLHMLLHK